MIKRIAKMALTGVILCFFMVALLFDVWSVERFVREWNHKQEKFEIRHSHCISFDNYKETWLSVIVNVDNYNVDELLIEVKEKAEIFNGKSDKLKIKLYASQEDLEAGICERERIFE